MPILVVCPKCGANLNAPDSGAGKQVRCPKPNCGSLVPVPALVQAEIVEDEEAPPPKSKAKPAIARDDDDDDRPRKKRRTDDDDDRDDERPRTRRRDDDDDDRPRGRSRRDDDDRPRKRRRDDDDDERSRRPRLKKRGMGAGAVVAIVIGSILLLGGIGYGVYALVSGGGPKSPPPTGWKEYTYAEDNFKAYFPSEPSKQGMGGFGGGGANFGGFGVDINLPTSVNMYVCMGLDQSAQIHVLVTATRFKNKVSSAERSNAMSEIRNKQGGGESKSVRWMGESAEEVTGREGTTRMVFVGNMFYTATIVMTNGKSVKPEVEKGFFDNFQLLK